MAATIPQPFIDDLLERVDIVEVVDSRVKLKKAGKNYSACCPFHDEKTPSFTVSQDKQFFYCFGCGASGNAIGFVMDYERVSFPEAIESLAKTAGVKVPREHNKNPQKRAEEESQEKARKGLYQLLESANTYYQQQLRNHAKKSLAVNYLKSRGLSGHIAKDFGIGYAPPGWDNLLKHLATSNSKQDLLLEGGMLIHNEQKDSFYDRFRERIMFPIRDTRGRVVGFGGRVLNDEKPKYLNSPETPIFFKGKELYGLYEARQAYRQLPRLLVVEGYMDVVALAQYGIRYGVATLGTACSIDHLQRAFRFTNEVVFCFDGDDAGRKAARRAMENALPVMEDGRQIKFLYLPEGEDPDTLIRHLGSDKFIQLIDGASPLEDFLFEEMSQGLNIQTMEGRARLCKLIAPLLDRLPRGIYRELMFGQLANRTQLGLDAVMTLLSELPETDTTEPLDTQQTIVPSTAETRRPVPVLIPTKASKNSSAPYTPDQLALALLLHQPSLAMQADIIEHLEHHQQPNIYLLLKVVEFAKQRTGVTKMQILGHWKGTHGNDAAQSLEELILKAGRFHQAQKLTSKEEGQTPFSPEKEFADTLRHIQQQQQQQDCDLIIEQLNNKPPQDWSDAEKQLYRKAIAARALI